MKITKIILSFLLVIMTLSMSSCSPKCTPKKATKSLEESLTGFKGVKVNLIKEENCVYLFSVKTKEFKTSTHYMVKWENKMWKCTPIK